MFCKVRFAILLIRTKTSHEMPKSLRFQRRGKQMPKTLKTQHQLGGQIGMLVRRYFILIPEYLKSFSLI
jgi:hypothetical protein